MLVLIPIGVRGGGESVTRVSALLPPQAEFLLLHVTDLGPREELGRFDPFRHGPHPHRDRDPGMAAAEEASAGQAMDEAVAAAQASKRQATTRLARGRPEQVIVQVAGEVRADLIVIRAREGLAGHPLIGPASVGHTARFVLDHAPCNVLLLRENG